MDDGGNYSVEDYDSTHNDYLYISYWAVNYISAFRSSVGDIQPPSYDYWITRFNQHPEMS